MSQPKECGCDIFVDPFANLGDLKRKEWTIDYCPLHQAAGELLELVEQCLACADGRSMAIPIGDMKRAIKRATS